MILIYLQKNETFDYNKQLTKYEKQVIEAFIGFTTRNTSEKESKYAVTLGYLLIKRRLTQKELKKLTHFSTGTIHQCLTMLELTGRISKAFIPGTHTFEYFVPETMSIMITQLKNSFQEKCDFTITFCKILTKNLSEKSILYFRLQEIMDTYSLYRTLLPLFDVDNNEITLESPMIDFNNDSRIQELKNSNFTTEEAEKTFIRLYGIFMNFNIYYEFSEPMKLIFGYFITRKLLTQYELKRITKLSIGAISQSINKLIEYELIFNKGKNSKGHNIYELDSIKTIMFQRFLRDLESMVSRKITIEQIKKAIEEDLTNLESSKVINKYLYTIKDQYQSLLSKVDEFVNILRIYDRIRLKTTEILSYDLNNRGKSN